MNEDAKLIYRLFQVAAYGLTHRHYAHVTAKAELYGQLVAGVNLDKLLKQFVKREDEELFKQRVALTQHIVTAVCKNLLDVFYKVPRSSSARRIIAYEKDKGNERKAEEVEGILSKFWGNASFDSYMGVRFIELNATDPNSFVVLEWDEFDGKTDLIQPRPFEVSSTAAVDFDYKNQVLQHLIVKDVHYYDRYKVDSGSGSAPNAPVLKKPHEGQEKGEKYTLYGKNSTWQLLQVDEMLPVSPTVNEGVLFAGIVNGEKLNFVKLGKKMFEYRAYNPHNLGAVPAFRVGYYRDLATDGATYVNPLHAAEPFLLKSITTNSHLDIVATLLAFPQQIKYGRACQDSQCFNGYYDNGKKCNTCMGSGVEATAPSAQDAIVLKMPENKDALIPMDELIKYIHPPVEIVKWQEDYVNNLTEKAKRTMYNSDTFTKSEVAKTATGENLDMQNVYDALFPFSNRHAKLWVFGVKSIAKLADRGEGLVANYTYGKDFKLKTLDTLIASLVQVNTLNNATLSNEINADIAEILFSEKPIDLQRYKLKQMFSPFRGKNDKDIALLMVSGYVSRKDKVLYANFERIFDELELDYGGRGKNFYSLNRTDQREEIYNKVDEIIKALDEENPAPVLPLD